MELTVQKREKLGKDANSLRKEGLIPAELYGHGVKNLHLSVPNKEFIRVFKEAGENTLIDVMVDGEKHQVMIHDVTFNPVTDMVASIDFLQVRLDELASAMVPVTFIGESSAVKEKGGLLVKNMHELEVEALPTSIPHTIEVNIEAIKEIGDSIYVKDITLPEGVTMLSEPENAIVTVTEKQEEEEVVTEVSVDDVKVEGEEKKAERDAEKAQGEDKTEA